MLALTALLAIRSPSEYRFHFNAAWSGYSKDAVAFARRMGYRDIVIMGTPEMADAYRSDQNARGMRFFLETPEYEVLPLERSVDLGKTYTPKEIADYERTAVWKSREAFPNDLATGWYFSPTTFSIALDFQQKAVVDDLVARIMARVEAVENPANDFRFGGFWWDVPDLQGDFWSAPVHGHPIGVDFWTGRDSGVDHPGVTHDYATYSDGRAAYYKALRARTRARYPGAKFIAEPYHPYKDWFGPVEKRADRKELGFDMVEAEGPGTEFVDDVRIFAGGLITPDRMGSSTPDRSGEADNRTIAAKAAMRGAWFNWSGRFGGTGDMPDYHTINEVPARLQLIRVVPGWDNLVHVPLAQRSWDGKTYRSPNSFADDTAIASRHPVDRTLYVVFLTPDGKVELNKGETLRDAWRTDAIFAPTGSAKSDLILEGRTLRLKDPSLVGKGLVVRVR